jgi:hypothetical protein
VRTAFALCVLLGAAACRAGAPPPRGHPLLGTWELVLPGSKCVETYDYRADGTSHTVSAGEETDTDYQVAATPNALGYYELTVTIRKTNGKPDCSGQLTPLGKPFTLYLAPLRGGFLMCFDPALQRCLGPITRLRAAPAAAP